MYLRLNTRLAIKSAENCQQMTFKLIKSKIYEHILSTFCEDFVSDELHSGFKHGTDCCDAILVMRAAIEYFNPGLALYF